MPSLPKYDPVPPYDMDDVESTVPSLANDRLSFETNTINTSSTARPEQDDHHNNSRRNPNEFEMSSRGRDEESNVLFCKHCNRRYGTLTEREKCNYAALFVFMSLFATCVMVSIVMSVARR